MFVSMVCSCLAMLAILFLTPQGARFAVQQALHIFFDAGTVQYEELSGNLLEGIRVRHLAARNIVYFPSDTTVRIQELQVSLNLVHLNGLRIAVENGRIFLHGNEPVIFEGVYRDGAVSGNVYARSIDMADVKSLLSKVLDISVEKGTLNDVDLTINGFLTHFTLQGKVTLGRLEQSTATLEDIPINLDVEVVPSHLRWETRGLAILAGGRIRAARAVVTLSESRVRFTGVTRNPELDIHAASMVEHVKIDIVVKGTRYQPHLTLSSDAGLSQEELLLMLTTGKKWNGLGTTASHQKMTPELAADFVDYFFFGGSGKQVAEFFGFSNISYKVEQGRQGVKVTKDLGEKMDVGYGVFVAADHTKNRDVTQMLESEYRVTDKVILGVQKELKALPQAGEVPGDTLPPDDRVYMKYKNTF
ncbi:MAG: translocation/assembly module TamB domain-containing protein [Candidatus Omnitrophica bacterium]|nr:translocation/assembly module TamB domain-containing protein [Candidatus Omnitrophota bacterium]